MHVYEWGDPGNTNVVVCVHGLTRNGRDFDHLAKKLSKKYRVICPDVVGRRKSGYLDNSRDYNYMTYVADMLHLMEVKGIAGCDWVGTSMGGLIGMMIASNVPGAIKKMVINDIGPFVSKEGLNRIGGYVGRAPKFATREEGRKYLLEIFEAWNLKDEKIIEHVVDISLNKEEDGYVVAYDPKIGDVFRDKDGNQRIKDDVDLWDVWEGVQCPVLVIRGDESDVLSADVAKKMTGKPNCFVQEFAGVGHAPPLMEDYQTKLIVDWFK